MLMLVIKWMETGSEIPPGCDVYEGEQAWGSFRLRFRHRPGMALDHSTTTFQAVQSTLDQRGDSKDWMLQLSVPTRICPFLAIRTAWSLRVFY